MDTVWQNMEVAIDSLPKVEEVYFQRHPLRYRTYRMIVAALWIAVLIIPAIILSIAIANWWVFAVAAFIFLVALLAFVGIRIGYKKRSYALRENDLTYKKGWIFYSITTIPFNRIQHTDVSQGPLERRFELSTLNIYTAGGSTSDLSIPGLEQEEAQQLRDFISKKAATYA